MVVRLFFACVAASITAMVVVFVSYTNQPHIRMSSLSCPQQLIYDRSGSANILIAGASRTLQGVDVFTLENRLSDGDGRPPVIVSLGRSWRGNGQIFHMLRDFMAHQRVTQALIVEFSFFSYQDRRSTVYANGYYPNYTLVTHSSDFAEDYLSTPREPWHSRLRDFMGNHLDLIDKRLDRWAEGSFELFASLPANTEVTKTETKTASCFRRDNPLKANVLERRIAKVNKAYGGWRDSPQGKWDIKVINHDRPSYYLHKIKKLADDNGIKLFLTLIPSFYTAPPDPAFIGEIEDKYGVPLLVPNQELLANLYDANGYTDLTHMAKSGRAIYSKWLADELKLRLDQ